MTLLFCSPLYADETVRKNVEFDEVIPDTNGDFIVPLTFTHLPHGYIENNILHLYLNITTEYTNIVVMKNNVPVIIENLKTEYEEELRYELSTWGSGNYKIIITSSNHKTYFGDFAID